MDIIEAAYVTAIDACRRATDAVMPLWPNPSNRLFDHNVALQQVTKDGVGNFATAADFNAERAIIETIQSHPLFKNHSIVTEESDDIVGDDEWRWIVDPIDGTMNFLNGVPDFGICVAVFCGDEPVVGVIAMPVLGQNGGGQER